MQHQVLHAMLGHPGPFLGPADDDRRSSSNNDGHDQDNHFDLLCSSAAAAPQHYECTSLSKSALSQAEVTSLNSIVRHGGHVAYLRNFVRENEKSQFCGRNSSVSSLYRHAIARTIGKLLDKHETKLLDIECNLRSDHCLGVEYVRANALPITSWIPHVADLVNDIILGEAGDDGQSTMSCAILDGIDRRMEYCTDEGGRKALEQILDAAGTVLCNQCMRWIVRGQLSDPADEFFIVRSSTDKEEEFELSRDRIPYSSLSFSLARRMLFVGRAVRILRQYESDDAGRAKMSHESTKHANIGSLKLHLERTVSSAYDDVSSRLCDMLRINFHLLHHLNNMQKLFLHGDGFFYSELLRECDAKDIWTIIAQANSSSSSSSSSSSDIDKDEWNILGGCQIFQQQIVAAVCARLDDVDSSQYASKEESSKQVFELSSFDLELQNAFKTNAAGQVLAGELFELSQDEVSHLPHTDASRLALGNAHDQVSNMLRWHDGGIYSQSGARADDKGAGTVVLFCRYNLPPPLDLIITDEMVQSSYNGFFRRLFSIQRASYELQKSWRLFLLPQHRNSRHGLAPLCSLRARMSFLVNNLLCYLKQDVVAASFESLQDAVLGTNDYEDLKDAHGHFLGVLRKGFFLDDPYFNESISRILALMYRFAALLQNVDKIADIPETEISRLGDIFDLETRSLFDLLRANVDAVGLCLRLDFNNHFTATP